MKPEESLFPYGTSVAANYRPAGMDPAVAKTQGKMLHSVVIGGSHPTKLFWKKLDPAFTYP